LRLRATFVWRGQALKFGHSFTSHEGRQLYASQLERQHDSAVIFIAYLPTNGKFLLPKKNKIQPQH